MNSDISNIRINDWFWIKLGNGFISFGYQGLPEDVHFTISLNEKSEYYNIHLTRNIGLDPSNKPRIDLVRIRKKDFEKVAPYSIQCLIFSFLKQVDVSSMLGAKFLSVESLQVGPDAAVMENHIRESLKPFSKLKRKGRFRIEGHIEDAFENLKKDEKYLSTILESSVEFSTVINTPTQGGILILDQKNIFVLKKNDSWFEFDDDVKPITLLSSIVGEEWAHNISEYTKFALERIRNAKTGEETKPWNTPIDLTINEEIEQRIDEAQHNQQPQGTDT